MKTIDEIFSEATNSINVSFGSMFTKHDVINILTNIKTVIAENEQPEPYASADDFDELEKNIINALDNYSSYSNTDGLIDYSSVELSIDWDRRIQIENIDLNTNTIATTIIEYITNK